MGKAFGLDLPPNFTKLVELHHEPQIPYRWSPVQGLDRCSVAHKVAHIVAVVWLHGPQCGPHGSECGMVGEYVLSRYRSPNVRVLQ